MTHFITFEGGEGAGKSTQCKRLAAELENKHTAPVLLTREPGGTELGESLRAVLLDPAVPAMHEMSELLLMFAARAEHLARVIQPALDAGTWVICDRFTDASYAYQGGGRGINEQIIATLETVVQDEFRPTLTILLDIDVNAGMERASARGTRDRFEQEQIGFFERVRASYLSRAHLRPERYLIVNADQDLEKVSSEIYAGVCERLKL